jgi:hypothetical protein
MDPLGGAASVIAVIQIAGAVIDPCYRYRSSLKDAPKTITRLMNEVRGVRVVLESLDTILAEEQSSGTAHLLALEEVMKGNGLLSQCSEELSGRRAWALMGQPKKPGPVAGLSRPMDKPIAKCGTRPRGTRL